MEQNLTNKNEIDERHWENGKIHCNKQNKISKNNKEEK
jgi:hypothetical protein